MNLKMNRIKVLAKEIADKIAAGEVIEAPLSVVKELVENSIDAESSQIVVEIKKGGKEYIRVSDNGSGIMREDLSLALLPHSTSKIRFAEDLSNISSLGFRGEALSSIAAVSELEIISKTEDEKTGKKIVISGSKTIEEADAASDTGTTVIVKDLFFNMPARRKFMKSDSKETAAISEFLSRISLAYPDIRFRFICDGTIRFSTPGKGDIYQTILTVYSPQNARKLLKLSSDNGKMSLKGYISSPLESRNNRRQQVYFVNGRLVESPLMESAVKTAYSDKLFEGRYPSVYLFLELDPSEVDVNVHPRKAEIKFQDETEVFDFVVDSIREALLDRNATAVDKDDIRISQVSTEIENKEAEYETAPVEKVLSNVKEDTSDEANIFEELIANKEIFVREEPEVKNVFKDLRAASDLESEKTEQLREDFGEYKTSRLLFSSLTPISQIFVTYILASDNENFYILDQHAAHERIMYEKLLESFNAAEKASQLLLAPMVIELDKSKTFTAESCISMLADMGFYLELFGDSSYLVKEIPYFMDFEEAEDFLYEFFDSADDYKNQLQMRKDIIISRSCKSAVKAHDHLSLEEMKALFRDLDKCENPFSCPHGRPTFIKFSEYELEKMFRRK